MSTNKIRKSAMLVASIGFLLGAVTNHALAQAPVSKTVLLWNKLGSDAEVTNSEAGPDGLIIGDISYYPGKFDYGFKPDPRTGDHNIPDNYIRFDSPNLGQQGTIEFWYQPDWVSGGHIRAILDYGKPDRRYLMTFEYNDWQNLLSLVVYDDDLNSNETIQRSIIPANTPEWSTTEPFHVAIVWDGTAATAADKVKLFLNGNERGALLHAGAVTFSDWDETNDLHLGSRARAGDWDRHNWEGSDGVIDNIRIWDYPKSDFADRFIESPFVEFPLDIKPGSCPNPLNPRSRGVLPAAVLGTSELDVEHIDLASLRLEGIAPIHSTIEDVSTPFEPLTDKEDCEFDCTDWGADGWLDLVLQFDTQEILSALGEVEDGWCLVLTLSGNLKDEYGGAPLRSQDVVLILATGRGARSPERVVSKPLVGRPTKRQNGASTDLQQRN